MKEQRELETILDRHVRSMLTELVVRLKEEQEEEREVPFES